MRDSKHDPNSCEQMQWAGFVAYVDCHSIDFNSAVLIYIISGSAHICPITALYAYWSFFSCHHAHLIV